MADHPIAAPDHSPDIAILLDHFGSGGVERVACLLASGLHRRGFQVEIVVVDDSGPVRDLLDEGVHVRPVGSAPVDSRGRRMKAAVPAIAQYLQSCSPRMLHAPGNHTIVAAAQAIEVAGYTGAFVAKITNPLQKQGQSWSQRRRRRLAYREALQRADLVLALTAKGARQVAALDRKLAPRTRVIHNPYVSDTMIARSAERSPTYPPVILSVGRLSKQKNQQLLVRAAARLSDRPWRLRICGTGPEEESLRSLADELGIGDRLELPGFVGDPIPEYLSATVMALSSSWEGLPATLLEAIACGCPVVSTASSPGLVELLRKAGARKAVALDSERGLARALAQALDGRLPPVDPSITIPYGIEAACDEHANLFAEMMGRQSTAGPNHSSSS